MIAWNIRRLREARDWSRQQLADMLSDLTQKEVSRWRIIDIEGARGGNRAPRSATWPELAALCEIFKVKLYDLLLPYGEDTVVVFPDVLIDRPKGSLRVSLTPASDRAQLGASLFGLHPDDVDKIVAGKSAPHIADELPDPEDQDRLRQQAARELLEILKSGELRDTLKTIIEEDE